MMLRSIPLGSFTFFADGDSRPGLDILQNGFNYEKHVVAELQKWVPSSKGFLDIGANCGIHSLIARSINPSVPLVCVEVSAFNVDILLRNLNFNGLHDALVLPFAASSKPGIIHANKHDPNMCVAVQGHPDSEDYGRLTFGIPLDLIKLPPIDLIKIDVEGFEIHALNGASEVIATRPRILFEFCPELVHRSGVTPEGFLQWFLDRGYSLTVLDYNQQGMRKEGFKSADECLAHIRATSKWIADLFAEPV